MAQVFCRYFLGRTNQGAKNHDKLMYLSLRHEFILERSSTKPFEVASTNRVSEDFRFSRYLGMCFGRMVGHAVDLEVTVWSLLAVCTTLFYFVVKASDYDEVVSVLASAEIYLYATLFLYVRFLYIVVIS